MKKISLVLCLMLLLVAIFAINVFAATSENVVKDAVLKEDGGCGTASAEMIRDGNVNTAASCGSKASWVNFHFLYENGINVSKVVVVVNSTGNVYYDTENVAESIKEYTELSALPNVYLRLYVGDSIAYKLENVASSNAKAITDADGNTLYTEYTFDLGGVVYPNITKVEVATVHGGSKEAGIWEVEIFDYACVEEADHDYTEATCTSPKICKLCGQESGGLGEHTWVDATCGAPKTCSTCGITEGEPDESKHVWKNASYTAPATCKNCGATKGDVWVDSTLPNFVRGDEGDTITYEDIIGEVTLTEGSSSGNNSSPEEVLDGSLAPNSFWGGPTGSSIKITLKNEWEIHEAKLILFSNWASLKVGFYAADGTLLGEKNIGGIQCNYDYFDGKQQANPTYTDYSSAVSNLAYGDNDKAVKYILITNTADKWGWVPGVVEVYFTGRERIPTACTEHVFEEKVVLEPTCTEVGYKQNICTICGAAEGRVAIPALDHTYDTYTIKTPADCTTAAVIEFACSRCGETIVRPTHIDDVTDYINLNNVTTNGAGGWTSSHYALFDNNMDAYLMASGNWFVQSEVDLDMNYYLTSATVWTTNKQYSSTGSHSAWMIFYYKAPGSDEWIEAGKIQTPAEQVNEVHEYTLVFAKPVYASAIKIFVGGEDGLPHGGGPGLNSYNGAVLEAKVAGSLLPETAELGHTWVAGETVAPNCTYLGYTNYTCSVCGETKKDTFVMETKVHDYSVLVEVTAPATCTEAGKATMACSMCNGTKEVTLDATGHDWEGTACKNNCGETRFASVGENIYATLDEALAAAKAGDTVVLYDYVVIDTDTEWNLEGITLKFAERADNYALVVNASLTINGGSFDFCSDYGIGVAADGTLVINNGTFTSTGAYYLVAVYGTATINGGSYESYYCNVNCFNNATVTINSGSFVAHDDNSGWAPSAILGDDENCVLNVYGGTYSTDVREYLESGYCVTIEEDDSQTVAIFSDENGNDLHTISYGETWEYVSATCIGYGYSSDICSDCGKKFYVISAINSEGHEWNDGVRNSADTGYDYECNLCKSTKTEITKGTTSEPIDAQIGNNVVTTIEGLDFIVYQFPVTYDLGKLVITVSENAYICLTDSPHSINPDSFVTGNTSYEVTIDSLEIWGFPKYYAIAVKNCDSFVIEYTELERPTLSVGANDIQIPEGKPNPFTGMPTAGTAYYAVKVPGSYILSAAEGEENAVITINGELIWLAEGSYEFTVAEGESVVFAINSDLYIIEEINLVLTCKHANVVVDEAKDATCTETGLTEGSHCGTCGDTIVAQKTVEAKGHSYDAVVTAPTCETNGYTTYTCTVCGDTYTDNVVEATGHTYGDPVYDDIGYTVTCTACGDAIFTRVAGTAQLPFNATIGDNTNNYGTEETFWQFAVAENGTVTITMPSADISFMAGPMLNPRAMTYCTGSTSYEFEVTAYSTLYLAINACETESYTFGLAFKGEEKVYVTEGEDAAVNVTVENYYCAGTTVYFKSENGGTYVITLVDGELNASIFDITNDSYIEEYPYEFTLAAGEEIMLNVATNDYMNLTEDTINFVISEKPSHVHTEVEIPAVLPTPSVEGYTAGIMCSECGETIKAPVKINVTELASDHAFRFRAASVSLDESISINYKPAKLDGYNNVYVVFVFEGVEYIVDTYDYVEPFSDGYRYSFKFSETGPELIASNIDAYCYAETADGFVMNKRLGYSIQAYLEGQLKANKAELTTVISNLLVMCSKVQLYMGVNVDNLIYDVFVENGYILTPTAFSGVDTSLNVQAIVGDRTTGTDWKAGSLVMGASTEINFKFETDNLEGLKVKVVVGNGEAKYFDVADLATETTSNGKTRYIVNVNYVKSYEFNEVVTATFERDGVQVGSTVTYSVNSYLVNNHAKSTGNTKALIEALYVYGMSANSYFSK